MYSRVALKQVKIRTCLVSIDQSKSRYFIKSFEPRLDLDMLCQRSKVMSLKILNIRNICQEEKKIFNFKLLTVDLVVSLPLNLLGVRYLKTEGLSHNSVPPGSELFTEIVGNLAGALLIVPRTRRLKFNKLAISFISDIRNVFAIPADVLDHLRHLCWCFTSSSGISITYCELEWCRQTTQGRCNFFSGE